jgi:hypothetical protein
MRMPTKKKQSKNKQSRTKLLAHHHTGKLRHHQHTSYGALALLLVLTCLPVFSASRAVASADSSGTSGEGVYAVVTGPVPKVAPTMSAPANGQTYTSSDPITVKGSCTAETLVKVFKNEVLAGAALCQNGGFAIKIDLFIGNNSLIVRDYNTNDAASPDSQVVSVRLLPPGTNLDGTQSLNTLGAPAGQFYVTSEIFHRGVLAGTSLTWPLILYGGQPPYAVSVSWGDGQTELFSRGDANRFDISHIYSQPSGSKGGYTIVVKSTDQAGANSYLQLVAIVNGNSNAAGIVGSISGGSKHSGIIKFAWQVLAAAVLVVVSFWLGEKRQVRLGRRPVGRTA